MEGQTRVDRRDFKFPSVLQRKYPEDVTLSLLYRLCRAGKVRFVNIGLGRVARFKISESDLLAFLDERYATPQGAGADAREEGPPKR